MRRWEDFFDRDRIEGLPAAVIFKWTFIVALVISAPVFLFKGLAALIGYHTVSWNGNFLTGLVGLFVGLMLGILVTAILTGCFATAILAARWTFSKLDLPDDDDEANHPPTG
jgi:hypothetical protein